jgi:hypothetical protein
VRCESVNLPGAEPNNKVELFAMPGRKSSPVKRKLCLAMAPLLIAAASLLVPATAHAR